MSQDLQHRREECHLGESPATLARFPFVKRWIVLGVSLFAFGAIDCSPVCRLRTLIELPAGVAVPPTLNLTLSTGAKSMPAPAPKVGIAPENTQLTLRSNGYETMFNIHGTHHWVQLTAWIDSNNDGKLDSGDLVGSYPSAIEVADHGLCAGNLTDSPPILLRVMP